MGMTAALGTMAAGTAMSAYGQIESGRQTDKLYQRNAQIAEIQARDAIARGRVEEKKARRETERVIGSQRVGLAAQNVDVNRGSALDVQADAAYLGELDALTIRNNAAKEAWGYRMQADDLRLRGTFAKREGEFGAYRTIIGAGSDMLMAKYGGGLGQRGNYTRSTAVPLDFNPATAGK